MGEKVELASKFGIIYGEGKREIKGDPFYVRAACEASLKRLDVDCIDLYYQHRIDTRVPIEITVSSSFLLVASLFLKLVASELLSHTQGDFYRKQAPFAELNSLFCLFFFFNFKMWEMKKLVEEGKIKYIGLSEASASTIRRAHAVHPITAVQIEWSLWTRDVEEEVVPTCRYHPIFLVHYHPLIM